MIYQILAAISFALISGNLAPVSAADLYAGRGMKDTYMPAPVTSHMAWYVRGDIGYAMHADPDITESGLYDLNSTSMDDTWTVGLGIGRYFTSNIRGDITWDHRFEADVTGRTSEAPFPGGRSFGLSSDVFLANLYYDFKRGGHVTPYIGAGIGAVRHSSSTGCRHSRSVRLHRRHSRKRQVEPCRGVDGRHHHRLRRPHVISAAASRMRPLSRRAAAGISMPATASSIWATPAPATSSPIRVRARPSQETR